MTDQPDVSPAGEVRSPAGLAGVGGHMAVYGFGSALNQVIAVIALPLYARWLGPSEYGLVEVLTVVVSLMVAGFGDGVATALLKLWYDVDGSDSRRDLLSTALAVAAVQTALAGAAALAVARLVGARSQAAVAVALLCALLTVTARVSMELFRATRRPWGYVRSVLVRSGLAAVLALVLIGSGRRSASAVFIGGSAGALAALVLSLVGNRDLLRPAVSPPLARRLAAFAVPLAPAALAGWSLMLIDRFVLARYETLSVVGTYGVANRVVAVLLLLVYAVTAAYTPVGLAMRPAGEQEVREAMLRHVLAAAAVSAVLLTALARPVLDAVVGTRYAGAADVVPHLAFALVLFATVSVTQVPLLAGGRTREMALASGAAAVANLVAGILLVPAHGMKGAAFATIVGFGTQAALYGWLAQRVSPARGVVAAQARVLAPAGLWLVAAAVAADRGAASVTALAALTFPVVLLATGGLRPNELVALANRLRGARAGT